MTTQKNSPTFAVFYYEIWNTIIRSKHTSFSKKFKDDFKKVLFAQE